MVVKIVRCHTSSCRSAFVVQRYLSFFMGSLTGWDLLVGSLEMKEDDRSRQDMDVVKRNASNALSPIGKINDAKSLALLSLALSAAD